MAQKTSPAKKARYAAYASGSVAAKNKAKKIARHLKKHPGDKQAAAQKPGARAGMTHDKRTPGEAALGRATAHFALFGRGVKTEGRDLSTAAARAAVIDAAKAAPAANSKAKPKSKKAA